MESTPSTSSRVASLRDDLADCWQRLPNKALFFGLLAVWVALFHWLGNATLGYVKSPSLFVWMYKAYSQEGSEDAHGLLIPLVVLGLYWWKRRDLLRLRLTTWGPGLGIVLVAVVLHVLGYAIQQTRVSIVAFFVGVWGLMGLAWGPQWLRGSLFPYFLFAFCVPMGSLAEPISFPLRLAVAKMVTGISQAGLGIDVLRDGVKLISGEGRFEYEVAAACSGLRSLIATVALATIYAFLVFPGWWKRVVLILSAFPLAMVGNVFRMLTIVIAAEIGGQRAGAYVHEGGPLGVLSLLPYVPAFLGLMLIARWLEEPKPKPAGLALASTS